MLHEASASLVAASGMGHACAHAVLTITSPPPGQLTRRVPKLENLSVACFVTYNSASLQDSSAHFLGQVWDPLRSHLAASTVTCIVNSEEISLGFLGQGSHVRSWVCALLSC